MGARPPGACAVPDPRSTWAMWLRSHRRGWEIRIIDENLRLENGLHWKPDVVALTALTPNAPRAYELALQYRAAGAAVVIGGMHASALPDEAAQFVDAVVVGEAEGVWGEVLADVEAGALQRRYDGGFDSLRDLLSPGAISILGVTSPRSH